MPQPPKAIVLITCAILAGCGGTKPDNTTSSLDFDPIELHWFGEIDVPIESGKDFEIVDLFDIAPQTRPWNLSENELQLFAAINPQIRCLDSKPFRPEHEYTTLRLSDPPLLPDGTVPRYYGAGSAPDLAPLVIHEPVIVDRWTSDQLIDLAKDRPAPRPSPDR